MTEPICENCAHFDAKKQYCKELDVPVIEENYCSKFRGLKP